MGAINLPSPVKPFCAILMAPGIALADIEDGLQHQFGAIDLRSVPFPFTQTTYYEREMGVGLQRVYITFDALIGSTELIVMKHTTNRLEVEWATASGDRRVNLDPGYLDLAKVILASSKDHAHRLYLGAGIYAEITLRYTRKQFQAWDWTYPDYRLPATRAFFEQVREQYKRQQRQQSETG
ncbi:MAG: DUF4416 family protein [bacterium]|nr:DUF4416 family protein [bacterium]